MRVGKKMEKIDVIRIEVKKPDYLRTFTLFNDGSLIIHYKGVNFIMSIQFPTDEVRKIKELLKHLI
jgi:hypothetical protein